MTTWITSIVFALGLTQSAPPPNEETPRQADKPVQQTGVLPLGPLMDSLLLRWTDEVWNQFDLDQHQRDRAMAEVMRSWKSFFDKNGDAISPILTEYIQMRMRSEPPDESRLRRWARDATPLMIDAQDHMERGVTEMRNIIQPHQQDRFEKLVHALRQSVHRAKWKLDRMAAGTLQPEEFKAGTVPFSALRQQRRKPAATNSTAAKDEGRPDRVAAELNAWRQYVEAFIKKHSLDLGQCTTARSVLAEMCQRAESHRNGRRVEIEFVEQLIEDFGGSKSERAALKTQLTKLYGPFDAMFGELDLRLHAVLTIEQKARAARAESPTPKPDNG